MTTLAELKVGIARDLRDADGDVFKDPELTDMVNAALVEVSGFAPRQFQEDITPLADTIEYRVQDDYFGGTDTPEIELVRVEVWDGSQTPNRFVSLLQHATAQPIVFSGSGWRCWNGTLTLTNATVDVLDPNKHVLRLWGYAPYAAVANDADVIDVSVSKLQALRDYCKVEGLQRLLSDRDLFTQWQTRPGNSDISPAGLMNQLAVAREDWRKRARALIVLRES